METVKGYSLSQVSYSYDQITGIDEVSVSLVPGKFYGLIGPNGSGKSTFLDILSGYIVPNHGTILLNNVPLQSYDRNELSQILAVVPQFFNQNFQYLVSDVVLMGRYPYLSRFSPPAKSDFEAVDQAMEMLGISHLRSRSITELSGGERQRVMIAKALAQSGDFILLDEVTSNLDINHTISIVTVLSKLIRDKGITVVAAVHDLNLAAACCDELIVLKNGTLKNFGPTSTLLSERLISELYGVDVAIISGNQSQKQIIYNYVRS